MHTAVDGKVDSDVFNCYREVGNSHNTSAVAVVRKRHPSMCHNELAICQFHFNFLKYTLY